MQVVLAAPPTRTVPATTLVSRTHAPGRTAPPAMGCAAPAVTRAERASAAPIHGKSAASAAPTPTALATSPASKTSAPRPSALQATPRAIASAITPPWERVAMGSGRLEGTAAPTPTVQGTSRASARSARHRCVSTSMSSAGSNASNRVREHAVRVNGGPEATAAPTVTAPAYSHA